VSDPQGAGQPSTIWTIGHSTRTLDAFVDLLCAHAIVELVDVRTVPRSARHPHFAREALASALPSAGIRYHHLAGLGGLRKARRDSTNVGWANASFRGYADHMQTAAFDSALDDLIGIARAPAAIMCAEAVWWRCHRQLIADALVARGWEVRHIVSAGAPAAPHRLTGFARVDAGRVTYPGLFD
jgi:uncharacterized protein (DUF488 family)